MAPSSPLPVSFFDLPRELWDQIYEYALGYSEIHITTRLCEPPTPQASETQSDESKNTKALSRSTFTIRTATAQELALRFDEPIPTDTRCMLSQDKAVTYTLQKDALRCHKCFTENAPYHLQKPQCADCPARVYLNLFAVSKQSLVEAAQTFYKQNTFFFSDQFIGSPAPTLLASLHDHSMLASNVRRLSLWINTTSGFGDPNCGGCHSPDFTNWAMHWTTIGNRFALSHLEFNMFLQCNSSNTSPWLLQQPKRATEGDAVEVRYPEWIKVMLEAGIRNVERLKLRICVEVGRDDRDEVVQDKTVALARAMRESFLENSVSEPDWAPPTTYRYFDKDDHSWITVAACYEDKNGASLLLLADSYENEESESQSGDDDS